MSWKSGGSGLQSVFSLPGYGELGQVPSNLGPGFAHFQDRGVVLLVVVRITVMSCGDNLGSAPAAEVIVTLD